MKDILLNRLCYVLSLVVLLFGFLLFYSQTGEWKGSLMAAVLAAALVYGACVTIKWLIEVFSVNNEK